MSNKKPTKKTEAAKILLAAGWSVEDVFEVLAIDEQPSVTVVERVVREKLPWYRPIPYLQHPTISMKAISTKEISKGLKSLSVK